MSAVGIRRPGRFRGANSGRPFVFDRLTQDERSSTVDFDESIFQAYVR
jgi:hypothetical protein